MLYFYIEVLEKIGEICMKEINLKIVSNRKLCKVNLKDRLSEVYVKYVKGVCLEGFHIDSLILREKDLSENEYEKLLLEIIDINKNHSIDLIPHTFWKLCIKHKINRVHLPLKIFEDLYNEKNAEFLSFFDILGVSVHTVDEAILAEKLGATYLVFGHIFSTDCKKNLEPKGIENLKYICESVSIPVYAIGGIDETNAYITIKNGAYGVCMMSNIMKKV